MTDFEKIWNFQNLYKAHKTARLGKRDVNEVIDFELELASNLTRLSDSIRNKTYRMSGYYSFYVHDPKEREIHALHYVDRVVQHCLCDEVLAPLLDKKLIYDNAACRINKGTHFALQRVTGFLRDYYRKYGYDGYFLKCDFRKFFNSIDHEVLKHKLKRVVTDPDVMNLLEQIIDSFEVTPGKGLPMGNQTSQWFAIYYLDGFDRLVKETFRIAYYSRYMDDCILIHSDKEQLKRFLQRMEVFIGKELKLELNEKTQIFPIRNGVDYLGWHLYLTENGKVIRKVSNRTKKKYKKRLRDLQWLYQTGGIEIDDANQVLSSYYAHLSFGDTYHLRKRMMERFYLKRE